MKQDHLEAAIECTEKANAGLDPELLSLYEARAELERYTQLRRLADFGIAALARRIDDPVAIARAAGTSVGKARDAVATGRAMAESADLSSALQHGEVSLDQAAEIAKAEDVVPGAAAGLVDIAKTESFAVLKEKARDVKLTARQDEDLAARQHAARSARHYIDDLGMTNVHLAFEPHIGTPLVARVEAEARRLLREARSNGEEEAFEAYLSDAYAAILAGARSGRSKRPELVVVVSHGVAKKGWKEVGPGEVCKIPGIGPISPRIAKEIAKDAFLTGLFYDGKDLRHIKRWTRSIPVEVLIALELGEPPEFKGVACVDCGNRHWTQIDHVRPRDKKGPTSHDNLRPRCSKCHARKTARERRERRAKPPDP